MALSDKNYLDYPGMQLYDNLLKSYINTLSNLAIKTILFAENNNNIIYFYKKANATLQDVPDFTLNLAQTPLATRVTNLENKGTYAGGTNVTLNGVNKSNNTASFFAPTAGGTAGQVLFSNGNNAAPSWGKNYTPRISNDTLIFD